MFFNLRCHSCGARSNYPKGTYHFVCTACDAPNYYDTKGDVLDPPAPVAAAPLAFPPTTSSFVREPSQGVPTQDSSIFCSRCRKNQQIYTEALANYLPDENHPRYAEFEAGLPAAKAKLEKEYPLVCTKCAKKAQHTIHKADYYGKSHQISSMALNKRRNRDGGINGRRNNWHNFGMRLVLGLVGMVVHANLLVQVAWHAYGVLTTLTPASYFYGMEEDDLAFDRTNASTWQMKALDFDDSCFRLFATLMSKALLANLCLLWYNPGLKEWYHPTWRMEEVKGQFEHFRIQAILLGVRTYAWFALSNVEAFTKHKLLASHGFMIVFCIACQWLSHRVIRPKRWTLKGKVTPKPELVDVFSATAGPADESYDRQASSVPPHLRLFSRDEKRFSIANLAPQRGYSKLDIPSMPPPSPPDTQSSPSDNEDAMDIDNPSYNNHNERYSSSFRSTTATQPQPSSWGAMRSSLFDIDDNARAKHQQQVDRTRMALQPRSFVQEQSPFRGQLPPAPMSMGKRLRNPPLHVVEEKIPLSQRSNFMEMMRPNGSVFGATTSTQTKTTTPSYADPFANDDDFSPVKRRTGTRSSEINAGFTPKYRTKEPLELRPAQFTLRSDLNNATGLEDLFGGGSFSIADPDSARAVDAGSRTSGDGATFAKLFVAMALGAAVVGVYMVPDVTTMLSVSLGDLWREFRGWNTA